MLDLLNGICKRIYHVYKLSILSQKNYTRIHTKPTTTTKNQARGRERDKIHHWAVQNLLRRWKVLFFFFAVTKPTLISSPPLSHPSPLASSVGLLTLVSLVHPCAPSDINCLGTEAPCRSAGSLLPVNRRTHCQAFPLHVHHLALTEHEKLLTPLEGFGPYSQASQWQVWGREAVF